MVVCFFAVRFLSCLSCFFLFFVSSLATSKRVRQADMREFVAT